MEAVRCASRRSQADLSPAERRNGIHKGGSSATLMPLHTSSHLTAEDSTSRLIDATHFAKTRLGDMSANASTTSTSSEFPLGELRALSVWYRSAVARLPDDIRSDCELPTLMSIIDGDSTVPYLVNVRHPSQLPKRQEINAARVILEKVESQTDRTVVIASQALTELRRCLDKFATTTTQAMRVAQTAGAFISSFGETDSQPVIQARQNCQRHLQSLVDSLQDEERKQAMFTVHGAQWRTLLTDLSQNLSRASYGAEEEVLDLAINGVLGLDQMCRKIHSELHPEMVLPDERLEVKIIGS